MRENFVCTAADAIYKLAAGNLKYLNAENGSGDISRRIRMSTWAKGQSPYAIIVTCSDYIALVLCCCNNTITISVYILNVSR